MDVAVSELRAHLSTWLARVREGQEVGVVTDRGTPAARLRPVVHGRGILVAELASNNVIARPAQPTRPATCSPGPASCSAVDG